MIATATCGESWSFSPSAPAQATLSTTAYVTPDAVLRAPRDPDVDGLHAQGVQGCLWPLDLPVAGSHDMDTPASEVHTHVSSCPMQIGFLFPCFVSGGVCKARTEVVEVVLP
jgi:hypothetical protein